MAKFRNELFAERIRKRRGEKGLRDVSEEIGVSIATLSRVENARFPDLYTFGILLEWLGDDSSIYFESEQGDDPIITQLRAAKNMSAGTTEALMEAIKLAYSQILSDVEQDMRA